MRRILAAWDSETVESEQDSEDQPASTHFDPKTSVSHAEWLSVTGDETGFDSVGTKKAFEV